MIDQGYTYLQLLLNNKSDFLLTLSQHLNKVLKHIEELQLLEIEAESFEYLKSSTKVILGTQDTVINIANTKKYFEERYFKVHEYESDHRFTSKFKEVIHEFSDFLLTGNIC